jgi:hypothetical protein
MQISFVMSLFHCIFCSCGLFDFSSKDEARQTMNELVDPIGAEAPPPGPAPPTRKRKHGAKASRKTGV